MSLNQNFVLKVILLLHIVTLTLFPFANCSYFRKTPRTVYFEHQGLNLELPCITEKRDVYCNWLKNGTVVPNTSKYNYALHSSNGDCSLTINSLSYPRDSTRWECQVPILSETVDYIKWPATTVVVLVKPSTPRFTNDKLNNVITAERITNITCVSEGGNPLPMLEWTLNGENITANATTTINDKTITSTLSYTFRKRNNGSTLICKSVHQTVNQSIHLILDVFYKPLVSVAQKMYTVLDGKDLEIDCKVDANPPATAYWKPNVVISDSKYSVIGNKLILRKLNHNLDGVVFQCSAHNSVGVSEPESIKLNVLYMPRLVETSDSLHKISLGGEIRLECKFIGNPKPVIKWNFIDSINKDLVHPQASPQNPGLLVISNASYLNEGDYYCDGINHDTFLNKDNIVKSNKFVVDISGKPYFLNEKQTEIGYQGLNTRIEKLFCSDPFPTSVYWTYGAMRLDVDLTSKASKEEFPDENLDSYHIKAGRLISLDPLSPNPTCFSAALIVANTDIDDKRDYVIVVQNSFGTSEGVITLMVSSPLSGAILISIALIILIMLFALTVLAILIMRRRTTKRDVEIEIKSEVPKTESSNVGKQDNGKNNDDANQLYANLDFIGDSNDNGVYRSRQGVLHSTDYAQISFDQS